MVTPHRPGPPAESRPAAIAACEALTREDLLAIPAIETSDLSRLPAQPVVSVLMITWRHERWITDAIAGVLAQRCPFPIELLLGEDCSPDRTQALCLEAQRSRPDIIRLVTAERNVGAKRNMLRLRVRARGRYLAFCEGDDYWTDPDKLAKQVAVLDADPGLSGCCTMVEMHMEDQRRDLVVRRRLMPDTYRPLWHLRDLLASRSQPHTCSLVYRNGLVALPRWFLQAVEGHKEQLLLHARVGPISCLPEVTAVYRYHGSGIASGVSRRRLLPCETFRQRSMLRLLSGPDAQRMRANLAASLLELAGLLAASRACQPVRRGRRELLAMAFRVRPRPWLRLVQAVLGIHAARLHALVFAWAIPRLHTSCFYAILLPFRRRLRSRSS